MCPGGRGTRKIVKTLIRGVKRMDGVQVVILSEHPIVVLSEHPSVILSEHPRLSCLQNTPAILKKLFRGVTRMDGVQVAPNPSRRRAKKRTVSHHTYKSRPLWVYLLFEPVCFFTQKRIIRTSHVHFYVYLSFEPLRFFLFCGKGTRKIVKKLLRGVRRMDGVQVIQGLAFREEV